MIFPPRPQTSLTLAKRERRRRRRSWREMAHKTRSNPTSARAPVKTTQFLFFFLLMPEKSTWLVLQTKNLRESSQSADFCVIFFACLFSFSNFFAWYLCVDSRKGRDALLADKLIFKLGRCVYYSNKNLALLCAPHLMNERRRKFAWPQRVTQSISSTYISTSLKPSCQLLRRSSVCPRDPFFSPRRVLFYARRYILKIVSFDRHENPSHA